MRADLPPQTVDASAVSGVDAQAMVLKNPVLNPMPAERRHTWGLGLAPHVSCQLAFVGNSGQGTCFGGPRLSFDFYLGKLIVDLKLGEIVPRSSSSPTVSLFLAGAALELGSPFLQLGGPTSPLSLAIRGVTRVRGGVVSSRFSAPGLTGSSNGVVEVTLGFNTTLALAITHAISIQAQVGIDGVLLIPVGLSVDFSAWAGLRFAL